MSRRTTVTLYPDHDDVLEDLQERDDVETEAEAIRKCIADHRDLQERVEALERDLDVAENRIQELERMLDVERRRYEEHQELVEYVDEERTWRSAGLATRARWWLFGKPEE